MHTDAAVDGDTWWSASICDFFEMLINLVSLCHVGKLGVKGNRKCLSTATRPKQTARWGIKTTIKVFSRRKFHQSVTRLRRQATDVGVTNNFSRFYSFTFKVRRPAIRHLYGSQPKSATSLKWRKCWSSVTLCAATVKS